jgi:2-oxo-hept-3-ene-1,7-dioate hydratase
MLDEATIAELAQRLHEAEEKKTYIRMFSIEHPNMTLEDAYAIQRAWTQIKLAKERVIKGHKIGLTSRAMQNAVGIDEPDYGVLFDDMFWNDGAIIPFEKYLSARIEVELAFVLAKSLAGPNCTIFDVFDATSYVTPALEILESRMHRLDPQTKATRKVTDTISDNAANAAIVTGGRPFSPQDADMRWVSALLFRNGQIEETGVAAGVLNNPAQGVAWLANRLAPHGERLEAGEVVLSGSFTRPVDVRKGDTFHADYGPYGSVSCHFA